MLNLNLLAVEGSMHCGPPYGWFVYDPLKKKLFSEVLFVTQIMVMLIGTPPELINVLYWVAKSNTATLPHDQTPPIVYGLALMVVIPCAPPCTEFLWAKPVLTGTRNRIAIARTFLILSLRCVLGSRAARPGNDSQQFVIVALIWALFDQSLDHCSNPKDCACSLSTSRCEATDSPTDWWFITSEQVPRAQNAIIG